MNHYQWKLPNVKYTMPKKKKKTPDSASGNLGFNSGPNNAFSRPPKLSGLLAI
jgi:hypothetical protein